MCHTGQDLVRTVSLKQPTIEFGLDRALVATLPSRGNGIEVACSITPFLSSRQPTTAVEIASRAGLPNSPFWRIKGLLGVQAGRNPQADEVSQSCGEDVEECCSCYRPA